MDAKGCHKPGIADPTVVLWNEIYKVAPPKRTSG